ncbi:hypothetical protein [Rhodococcus sp. ARC_M6]|uniref:hypothetical protein n=1 Tax=Rhodococcus sp. ARC_M6 TaxID=2928852 RepID=UPI001FB4798D|nr:hypothetical protein [Rhodococcus sp. ARC_M6]MCJ0906274.1 hypothetical protein [Rhodococcus sp. ARC_M6]
MLCLIESTLGDYPPVGGCPVSLGSVWDVEPDPPAPFHNGDIVEHVLQIHTDVVGAAKYVAALRPVLSDTLTTFGRWQILSPVPASERTATLRTEHRLELPTPGNLLWEIYIGLRGNGDHTILGDQLVHSLSAAGMHFDQLITRFYAAGTEEQEHVLSRYLNLQHHDDR